MNRVVEESPPVKEAMKEDENEMSLNQLCLSNESDGEVDGENGDYFRFLALPSELIGHIFSFLSIKDRLRARVNRRLNKIELEYKYYVDKLAIIECSEAYISAIKEHDTETDHHICFNNRKSYSSSCIKRLTQNLSVGFLGVTLKGASDFHREVYNLIKDFNVRKLQPEFWSEMMADSFFLDLSRTCKELDLRRCDNITPNALHQMMKEGSTKLREVRVNQTDNKVTLFLNLIGISYRDKRFLTNRDIEGIEYHDYIVFDEIHNACLFDGNLEIHLQHYLVDDEDDIPICSSGQFSLKMHDSNESIDEAKTSLVKAGYNRIQFIHE